MKALLVGPTQQENLALAYLVAAAKKAGHEASIVTYAYRADLDAAISQILEAKPDLVGLGIAFQNNIADYLTLLHALRDRGYQGHVTSGGHVPTFCWRELMEEVPGLDTVVRHDGEATLVEVLDALARGEAPKNIAGLVWRDNGEIVTGPLRTAAALDDLPWPVRTPEPYSVGGVVSDFLITARGCVGECNYCSIAAYTHEQRKPYRLREPEAVAEEIAFAYHERGARVFFVQDDLFVLPSEKQAALRMDRLKKSIDERGAKDAVFWIKGRPEHVTPAVCEAARAMGAIHMFLGVESASAKRLSYLGRTHLPIHNESAIGNCRAAGILPSFNFMLFDPDCSIEDVRATLDMAEHHLDLPWNVCRTEIYSGTSLKKRLEAEGRLEGNWRSYGYRMKDERAELAFRIVRVSLHERALAIDSILNRLISLSFARQLHERYFPGKVTSELARRVTELGVMVRRDTVERLREVMRYVDGGDTRGAQKFAVGQAMEIGAFDAKPRAELEQMWNHMTTRGAYLMARAGQAVGRGRSGWEVAAGS